MNITCPRCGKENPEDVRFCLGCGTDLHGRANASSSMGRPPPLGGPPRLQPPPPLGGARPAGGPAGPAPLGPPLGPPSFGGGPAPLNAPPSLSSNQHHPSNPMGAPPPPSHNSPLLGPMPSLGGPPQGAGMGAPPGMGSFATSSPLGPPPSMQGGPPMGGPPPLLGSMPALPGAAPPSVSPSSSGAMPHSMGGLPPLMGSMPSLMGGASHGMPAGFPPPGGGFGAPPPMSPNPFGSSMAPVPPGVPSPMGMPPAVPPMGPPPVPAYGAGDPFGSSDRYGSSGDAFANVAPSDPYGSIGRTPAMPPAASDPFAALNNPFAASAMGPPVARPMTGAPGVNTFPGGPAPMPTSRARGSTVGAGGAVWPASPQTSFHQDGPIEGATEVRGALSANRPRLMVTQLDGSEQGEMSLNEGDNLIGREVGGIFAEDNLLSGRHATIIVQGSAAWVRDEGSRNGVYARVAPNQRIELQEGDQFCLGRIILRFDHRAPPGLAPSHDALGYLSLVVGRDVDKALFPLAVPNTGLTLGRSRSNVLFPNDGWISGLHCQLLAIGPQVFLVDLKSSNGTYSRIRGTRALNQGDALLMGQRIFHVHLT